MKKTINVVAAIIIKNEKILCVQRPDNKFPYIAFKYEFPGGKIEPNETKEDAIKREIKEELDIEISIGNEYLIVTHEYPDFIVNLQSFICQTKNKTIRLIEHIDYKWLNKSQLLSLDWAEADFPIVKKLMEE